MSKRDNQPDWDKIAEKFDLWLPHIAPVGDELISALSAQAGDEILDLASGTGEPALTLASRFGDKIQISGVDSAEGMIKVAQKKAAEQNLSNLSFQCMPAEQLSFGDNSYDKALCRFGVMLFEDPQQGLKEIYRVLKPGGRLVLAVWNTPETMPTLKWAYESMKNLLPEDLYPPLLKVTSLSGIGKLDQLLEAAGFSEYTIETKVFDYQFDSFSAYWDVIEASDIMKMQFDAISANEKLVVRDEISQFAQAFIKDNRLVIPHEYLLACCNK
ncbi:MAG: class I SAM-dependent methyltransferase [Gammaproteobacteria bacterium]